MNESNRNNEGANGMTSQQVNDQFARDIVNNETLTPEERKMLTEQWSAVQARLNKGKQ